ncbi:Bro-N domain-containing protein [Comamonas sp. NoAH]|uniref:BRO-N domain-containing protein n=1 Tax=Comamonas halotolerans TaxID=3041496 RepID=UPI0024E0EB93|nr:Bro-N domain-containing protein [Comamonas sp. NoAH]
MESWPKKGNAPGGRSPEALSEVSQYAKKGTIVSNSIAKVQKSTTISPDPNKLAFNSVSFDVVMRDGRQCLKAVEIGRALGYSDEKAIQRIYARHADEFTQELTGVVKLTTPSGKQESRVFSLRGAHLLAMFARTKIAKDFRKWVLDVLDREVERQAQKQTPVMSLTDCGDKAQVGKFLIAMRKGAVQHLAQIEKQMVAWEIVDERMEKGMPAEQAAEIGARIERLGKLFHPFSEQFTDVLGISRALRGLDPRMGASRAGWVEVLPKITA